MNDRQGAARAHVEFHIGGRGVQIALSPRPGTIALWQPMTYRTGDPSVMAARVPDDTLFLPEDEARALYEALAEYFGGTVVDARALRKDYDAERLRVDGMIRALIDGPRVVVADGPGVVVGGGRMS